MDTMYTNVIPLRLILLNSKNKPGESPGKSDKWRNWYRLVE